MKYKSCPILKHGLCFFNHRLVSCCFAPCDQINGTPPLLYDNYNGELISKEYLFEKINQYNDIFKKGSVPAQCKGCYKIEEKDWDEEEYIDYITITHFSKCNLDCIYCSNNLERDERTNDCYKIIPVLNNFVKEGIISPDCQIHIGGGELTIYDECNEIIDFVNRNKLKFFVATNALVYNEKLHEILNNEYTCIIVSLDSGTRKTYKKLKRVDAFDKVIANLKKYAQVIDSYKRINLKYIVIPTVNDNFKEFCKFLDIAQSLGLKFIIIDLDARYCRLKKYNVNPYLIKFAQKLENEAKRRGFETEIYNFINQSITTTDNKHKIIANFIDYIKYKFINKDVKKLYKNRKY